MTAVIPTTAILAMMTKKKSRVSIKRIFTALAAVLLLGGCASDITESSVASADPPQTSVQPEYASRLFDDSYVHTIDLQVQDWGRFIETAAEEEYIPCDVVIDGETFSQVGLRTKGNNSLRKTGEYGLCRYSLKLEFDQYLSDGNYYGLDKFSLDSAFQDNSYMKTFLAYDMMSSMGVPSPLCSYVWVTLNGTDWGLFLALEEPEESFADRCFGEDHGQLYKPDYRSLNAENADVDLRYVDDSPLSYDNIFRKAKFDITRSDQQRLIEALRILSTGENLETAVNIDEVMRYFAVQVFVINLDSYIGPTGHNYFLYEENGVLSMLPWDYNLAFGTYCLGMSDPITDPNVLINYPVNTPWEGDVMLERPMFHKLMQNDGAYALYHEYLRQFTAEYVENGRCEEFIRETAEMISPYVERDPTAFCTYEDHLTAVETLVDVCTLRSESISGQLDGLYPITIAEREKNPSAGVDAAALDLQSLGDFDDMENALERQTAALEAVLNVQQTE